SCSGQQTEILTAQERSWLDAHRHDIAVVQDRYYAPYEFCLRDSDIVQGMMYDYMSLIEKKLNVRFSRRSPRDLSTNLEIIKQRDAAVINAVTKTPERSVYLLFADPVIEMRNVILVGTLEMVNYRTGEILSNHWLQYAKVRHLWRNAVCAFLLKKKLITLQQEQWIQEKYKDGFNVHVRHLEVDNNEMLGRTANKRHRNYYLKLFSGGRRGLAEEKCS
ncbi:MAG: transporter substrate-binding domain-containing protein, partial [Spirochaetota bacterium]